MDIFKSEPKLEPTILTIFGATGNLTADYLLPALLHMQEERMLPPDFRLVVVGRRSLDEKSYFKFIVGKSRVLSKISFAARRAFAKKLTYFRGDFDNPQSFAPLGKLLQTQEQPRHECFNRLYYFATSPQFFSSIAKILKNTGLLRSCAVHERKVRILVEKPFGFNLKSAKSLNQLLLKYFNEEQIYRIDHYLGKETVQNLMVVRFANTLFEPLWNSRYIDHIEISAFYDDLVSTRAYFDDAGMLKDAVQNHLLQMLALIAMDEPRELLTEDIRDEKFKILKALRPFNRKTIKTGVTRGQYDSYQKEIGRQSQTETYVALKTFVDLPRWKGVPFYLQTGKALKSRTTEISIHFKELKRCLFRNCRGNIMTFRIQPDESVHLQINNKIPGVGVELEQTNLFFGYKEKFKTRLPPAYERLLLDFIEGDQRLFIRSDEIEAAWKFIDSITDNWGDLPIYTYKIGSAGPPEAEALIKKDNREWQTK